MLDGLEKEIVALSELFDELADKVSPILLPETPPGPEAAAAPEEEHSIVSSRVVELQNRLLNLRSRVSAVLSRVDLPI